LVLFVDTDYYDLVVPFDKIYLYTSVYIGFRLMIYCRTGQDDAIV
jgi:hypothetical protein